MWRFLGLASGLLALAGVVSAEALAAEPQRWALVVGVNDYTILRDLNYASRDAQSLAESLVQAGFNEKQVFLVHDGAADARYKPFKANIEQQLDLVLNLAGKDDLVVVSFSGHGMHLDDGSYLCPSEAHDQKPHETMIPVNTVYEKFSKCRAALKLLLVDACRNDPRPTGRKAADPKADLDKLGAAFERPPEGIVVLASCGPGQTSYEDEQLKHGVFMHFLMTGLAGEADSNHNNLVSLGELYEYASQQTKVHVARVHNDFQVPAQRGEINGVFELPRSAPPLAIAPFDAATAKKHQQAWAAYRRTDVVITNSIGMKLVAIPPGEFMMGSPEGEEDRDEHELLHRVRITRGFEMGMYEVTVGEFRKFVASTNHRTDAEADGKGGWGWTGEGGYPFKQKPEFNWRNWWANQTDQHPVVNVSWNDAVAFCQWLSQQEGATYRLPTEAEWEYACRAGTTTRFYGGNGEESLEATANIADASAKRMASLLSGAKPWDDSFALTAPVGKFKPNGFGLFDMHGNVWEWCQDWHGEDYYAANTPDDPKGSSAGANRVIRGGSWSNYPSYCRSAHRFHFEPADRSNFSGFRVVRGR